MDPLYIIGYVIAFVLTLGLAGYAIYGEYRQHKNNSSYTIGYAITSVLTLGLAVYAVMDSLYGYAIASSLLALGLAAYAYRVYKLRASYSDEPSHATPSR